MAKFDSEDARRYMQFLDNEVGEEVKAVETSQMNDDEKNDRLDVLKEVKNQMAFEYGLDNYEL